MISTGGDIIFILTVMKQEPFKAGGGATSGLALISRVIPVPPTQLASVISE